MAICCPVPAKIDITRGRVKEYPPTHVAEHTTVHPSIVFALTALGVAIIATMNSKPFKESKPTPKLEQGINSKNIASLGDTHMGGQKSSETPYANVRGMSVQSMQSGAIKTATNKERGY